MSATANRAPYPEAVSLDRSSAYQGYEGDNRRYLRLKFHGALLASVHIEADRLERDSFTWTCYFSGETVAVIWDRGDSPAFAGFRRGDRVEVWLESERRFCWGMLAQDYEEGAFLRVVTDEYGEEAEVPYRDLREWRAGDRAMAEQRRLMLFQSVS